MSGQCAFSWPVRAYYQHTDAGGVVYHGAYLDFMEAARAEMLRSLGFDVGVLSREQRVAFTVHTLQITYHRPALLGDGLTVVTRCVEARRVRLVLEQDVMRGQQTLANASVTLACIDALENRPVAIPVSIREALGTLRGGT